MNEDAFAGDERPGFHLVFGARRRYERGSDFERDLIECAERFNSAGISAKFRSTGPTGLRKILALRVPTPQIRDAYRALMMELDVEDGGPDVHERCEILIAMCTSLKNDSYAESAASSNSASEKDSVSPS